MIAFYAAPEDNNDIFIVDARGGAPRRLTTGPQADSNPHWSCDGKFIYYLSQARGEPPQRMKIQASGGTPVPSDLLTETRDCKNNLTTAGWPDHYRVLKRPMSGGNSEVVADGIHATSGFAVVPDGVYYIGNSPVDGRFPLVYRSFAGERRNIALVKNPFWGLTVSPDEQTILYVSGRTGDINLNIVEGFK
jgi:hypothetical protein